MYFLKSNAHTVSGRRIPTIVSFEHTPNAKRNANATRHAVLFSLRVKAYVASTQRAITGVSAARMCAWPKTRGAARSRRVR